MSRLTELQIEEDRLRRLIALAREEDLGARGDITTKAVSTQLSSISGECTAQIVSREEGVICGLKIVPFILEEISKPKEPRALARADQQTGLNAPRFRSTDVSDEDRVTAGTILGTIRGDWPSILASERVVLNFLQRLSGIATLTRRFVGQVEGTAAKIYDTRKTTPGMRDLEKYAVRCGGGNNHRHGLHDAILVKDNHLAGIPTERLANFAFELLNEVYPSGPQTQGAAGFSPRDSSKTSTDMNRNVLPRPRFVEFEVDSLEQFEQLLKVVGIDVIMLDNFSLDDLRRAVEMRNQQGLKGKLELEASSGTTLDTVRPIAQTDVERISVGAITHSAPARDISIEILEDSSLSL